MPDENQMELPFDEESSDEDDEPISYSQEEAGGSLTCGTCGEPIHGEVYFNPFGPAHYRCYLRETL